MPTVLRICCKNDTPRVCQKPRVNVAVSVQLNGIEPESNLALNQWYQ